MCGFLSNPALRRPWFLLVLALGGCVIADSTILDRAEQYKPGGVACSSSLGSYSLPKSFIRVVIGQDAKEESPPDLVWFGDNLPADGKFKFDIVRRADPALTVCLDYLASAFAHDEVTVLKQDDSSVDNGSSATISRQFLRSIIVNATDKSVQIAQNLIRTAFIGLSGNSDFGVNRDIQFKTNPTILADLEFDPFDVRDAAEANFRLSRLGFCLVLEGFTYDRRSMSVDQYCNAPFRVRGHMPRIAELYAATSREPIPPNVSGILYRPRQTYMVSVYQKSDPGGRDRWNLTRRVDVDLENLSPVISVGLTRAIFARRNAYLNFDEGTLQTVCIAKSSELENFVAIPFEIARGLVALPAQIVKVKINRIAKHDELARVEELFIRTQAALIKTRLEQKAQQKETGDTSPADQVSLNSPLFDPKLTGLAANANTFTIDDPALQKWVGDHCGPKLTVTAPTN